MKQGTRWLIRLLMLLPIIIIVLNNPMLIIDNPRDGYVLHAALAVGAPREVTADPVLPKKQEILTLLKRANSWQMAHPVMKPDDRNWERATLNRKEYLPAVEKAWAGLTESLSPEGKVLWGQQVDGEPHLVARESTHEYVTGTFLLSGSEMYKLAH